MKKLLLFLAPVILAVGCAEKFDFPIPAEEPAENVTRAAIAPRARSLDGAIYNEIADVY